MEGAHIEAGWTEAGLYPFSPETVLGDIQKPLSQLTIPKADEMSGVLYPQGKTLEILVITTALLSLRIRIEQMLIRLTVRVNNGFQSWQMSDKHRLLNALLLDENQLLFQQNYGARSRRSTKSTVVRQAKVMSSEDIEEARV